MGITCKIWDDITLKDNQVIKASYSDCVSNIMTLARAVIKIFFSQGFTMVPMQK